MSLKAIIGTQTSSEELAIVQFCDHCQQEDVTYANLTYKGAYDDYQGAILFSARKRYSDI